ncbi:MAG TPA: D-arabinitol 4-dehydrogenase [Albitalea sp.]|nr:D-arabinitol 4-dehydrogenase [Albitalea sp.]
MLHLGVGSFHRAHQAVYLHRLRQTGDTRWSIVGANIRNDMADTMAALMAQNGAYTVETVSPSGKRDYEWIRAIREVIPFDAGHAGLIAVGADAATRIVSFTVTEAGYYLDTDNQLDLTSPDLAADIQGRTCSTIYGAIAAILRERLARGGAPLTLLNCDNLRSNGERFRAGLLAFLERRGDAALRDWVLANTSCPNAMVDRITPRPPPELAARVKAATGRDDGAPVMGERFIQWVIEDDFIAGRPAWEKVGVEMVASVHAHEEAKIRVLNATHSCIAWAGTLRGLGYIHEGVALPEIRQMAFAYVTDDVIPCLERPEHPSPIDLPLYRDVVLDRFSNPWLRDTNQRVAMDGYSKIPGFIVPTLRERLARGESIASTAMLPALFFAVLGRWHRGELAYSYQDGVMDPAAAHALFTTADPLAAFCRDPMLWGELAGNESLTAAMRAADARVQSFMKG